MNMATDLNVSQLRAIKKAACLGRILQDNLPGIAQDYRDGLSQPKIAEKYDIMGKYHVGENTARNAVAFALRGHDNNSGIESYPGLIPDKDELSKLGLEHQVAAIANALTPEVRKNSGKKAYKQGLGIHARTHEQRIKDSRKGGVVARDSNYGFHALTPKQKLINQRNAIIASGKTLWTTEEKNRVLELKVHPDYQSGKKGPCYKKIADKVNEEFHNGKEVRTRSSINYLFFRSP